MKKVVCASPNEADLCGWFQKQAAHAREWVKNDLNVRRDIRVNLFEVTMRAVVTPIRAIVTPIRAI